MVLGADDADTGVAAGSELWRFLKASLGLDAGATHGARAPLLDALGEVALTRAAGVIAFFDAINRVADATGVEVDEYLQVPDEFDATWRPGRGQRAG